MKGALLVLALLAAPVAASAQEIGDAVSCADCRIRSSLLATLDHEAIGSIMDVMVDGQDRYWVINFGDLPVVFDRTGRFHGVFGRTGDGPAELRQAVSVWQLPGDSIAVFDRAGKLLVFNGSLDHVRTVSLPLPGDVTDGAILEWPGNVVINAEIPAGTQTGFRLHSVDFTTSPAVLTHSFDAAGTFDHAERPGVMRAVVAQARDGGLWVAPRGQYSITHWSSRFQPRPALSRRPEWFARASTTRIGRPDTPPAPSLIGLEEDEHGRLWVYSLATRPDWRLAWQSVDATAGEVSVTDIAWEHFYYTKIEVIDLAAMKVVARHTLDRRPARVLPGRRAAFTFDQPDGRSTVRILEFALVEP
jgi:hypothetical protein